MYGHRRQYSGRGVVDGWGLLHEILADCVEDLLRSFSPDEGAAGGSSSWTLVTPILTDTARDNAVGMHAPAVVGCESSCFGWGFVRLFAGQMDSMGISTRGCCSSCSGFSVHLWLTGYDTPFT